MNFPEMYRVRQNFNAPKVKDIDNTINLELSSLDLDTVIQKDARIAITAGSRGIANIDRIYKNIIQTLKAHKARPFIVPAMGSHGNGTAEGQLEVLKSLNITQESMGVPIITSMEVKKIGTSPHGLPILVDKNAAEADGIVVVNRIKPHTEFEGPIESGLMKMMAIGLGKHKGCFQVHKQTVNFGYSNIIPGIGKIILNNLPVLFGVGIVENIYDETAIIKAIQPDQFIEEEKKLLTKAKQFMAKLPFDKIDILVIDEMGKNISGTGMDTNVIGRIMFVGEKEPSSPDITRIVVLGLTDHSHGNAVGIGLADFTTQNVVDKIDPTAMATNAITAMTPEKARLPISFPTDIESIEAAFKTIGAIAFEDAKIIHIKNTLEMSEMDISHSLKIQAEGRTDLKVLNGLGPLSFDPQGRLNSISFDYEIQ